MRGPQVERRALSELGDRRRHRLRHAWWSSTTGEGQGDGRAEIRAWGLGDVHFDPGEVLLRLVSQSSQWCELYAGLLQQAYDAA